jgi:hypothetical protein
VNRKVFLVIFAVTIAAQCFGVWTLVASCSAPGPNPRGVSVWSGPGECYTVVDGSTPYVYRINTYNGLIAASFAAPGGAGAWGITSPDYSHFYISNNATSYIYYVTTAGSLVSSFHCQVPGPADMDYTGTSGLDVAFPNQNYIGRVNTTTGSVVSSTGGPGTHVTASARGPSFIVADSATHIIYENGSPAITGIQTPVGLAAIYEVDDATWLTVSDDATDKIYLYTNGTSVEPSSFGRVKAVYR